MKNGLSRTHHVRESITARVLVGVATVAVAVMIFRALPDLIRYLRVRRM